MKTMEWRFDASRPSWYPYPGPWDDEPDKAQWIDDVTGLPCLIVRNRLGALCGYVGVSAGHPFFEKEYDDVPVDVHGGLTFAGKCQPVPEDGRLLEGRDPEERVCHVVDPGEDDNVWWLGFDCAHMNDLVPGMNKKFEARPDETVGQIASRHKLNEMIDERITMHGPADDILRETYKTFGYVKEEVTQLAAQLRPLTRTQRVHRRLKGEAKQ